VQDGMVSKIVCTAMAIVGMVSKKQQRASPRCDEIRALSAAGDA